MLLASLSNCQKESAEIKKPQSSDNPVSTDNEGGSAERINAWEAPFNLTESDIPSNVVSKLQSAINFASLNNKELIVEKGTYTIDGPITFPSGVNVDFSGAEFKREPGTGPGDIFTMFANGDVVNGNDNITIKNLKINGNKIIDNLDPVVYAHRFSGLRFIKVTNSKLYRITATQTVNAEISEWNNTSAGGIFFDTGCNNINCYELDAYDNDRTGIMINFASNIRIYGSLTYNNAGSGISSGDAPRCEYYDIISYHNGYYPEHSWGSPASPYHYSNVSVNGHYSKVNGVLTYDCTGSGLVLGHPGSVGNSSDYSIVDNVESYGNELEGITVSNSKHVLMSNLHIYDNLRNNIQIYDSSSAVQIQNAVVHGYNAVGGVAKGGQGIIIIGGSNYNLNNINAYNNFGQGIYISGTTGVSIGSEVNAYNNGQVNLYRQPNNHDIWTAGIEVYNASKLYVNGTKTFSDQPSGSITQKYGIILQSVNTARVNYAQSYGNGTQNAVKELGTNTDVTIVN
jgi:hypothetical protein